MKPPISNNQVLALCVIVGTLFGYGLIGGFLTGTLKIRTGQRVNRKNQPIGFWVLMSIYAFGFCVAILGILAARPH